MIVLMIIIFSVPSICIWQMYLWRDYRWLLKEYSDKLTDVVYYIRDNKIDLGINDKFSDKYYKHKKFFEFYQEKSRIYKYPKEVKKHIDEIVEDFPEVFKSEYREQRLDDLLESIG